MRRDAVGPGQESVWDYPRPPSADVTGRRIVVEVGGVGMLVHQAAIAFRLWTGEDAPLEAMSAALLAELGKRAQNS